MDTLSEDTVSVAGRPERRGGQPHLLIVGGGSAAFAAAIRAAELGARVTMVERGTVGGTCVNVGCVPSKTLIRAAEIRHLAGHHPFDGLPSGNGAADLETDLEALVTQKDQLVARLRRAKYRDVLASYPDTEYVEGEARFTEARTIEVALAGGGDRRIEPDRVLLATGSSPWVPPVPGLEDVDYWTSADALAAEELPDRLVVVGGSAVGAELAQMFARLGSRVTLLEALPTLVPNEDPELGEALARHFREEGLEVHTGAAVTGTGRARNGGFRASGAARASSGFRASGAVRASGAFRASGGTVRVTAVVKGHERTFTADRLLLATGRRANTGALALEAVGVETDARGFIRVDAGLRTNRPGVYAAGDCTPLPQFVYVAAKAGTVAAENAVGEGGRELDLSAMPAVTFTDPQVASVGLTEPDARKRGERIKVRTLPLEHVPRALVNRDTRGLVKLVARASDGRLLGAHVLSPAAGEVIQSAVLAVKHGLTVEELSDTLFPYLTEVEALKLAAQTYGKRVEQLSCCAG